MNSREKEHELRTLANHEVSRQSAKSYFHEAHLQNSFQAVSRLPLNDNGMNFFEFGEFEDFCFCFLFLLDLFKVVLLFSRFLWLNVVASFWPGHILCRLSSLWSI